MKKVNAERLAFLEKEKAKQKSVKGENTLDEVIQGAVRAQAIAKGYVFK